jgi:hypothetical protein
MEGSGCGLILRTIPEFAWRDWGKSRQTSVIIAGLRDEIWTGSFGTVFLNPSGTSDPLPKIISYILIFRIQTN